MYKKLDPVWRCPFTKDLRSNCAECAFMSPPKDEFDPCDCANSYVNESGKCKAEKVIIYRRVRDERYSNIKSR
jgi:hypothetical protein